jgi:hypothetical protein
VIALPLRHGRDLFRLRLDYSLCHLAEHRVHAKLKFHLRHVDGALMVRDHHHHHEVGVGVGSLTVPVGRTTYSRRRASILEESNLTPIPTTAYPLRFERSVEIDAPAEAVSTYLDDQRHLSAHMSQSSWMMVGSRMDFEFDAAEGRRFPSTGWAMSVPSADGIPRRRRKAKRYLLDTVCLHVASD